jgi:hypothetical protein
LRSGTRSVRWLFAVGADDALLECVVCAVGRFGRDDAAFRKAAGPVGIAGTTFAEPEPTLLLEGRVPIGQSGEVDVDGEGARLGIAGLERPVSACRRIR